MQRSSRFIGRNEFIVATSPLVNNDIYNGRSHCLNKNFTELKLLPHLDVVEATGAARNAVRLIHLNPDCISLVVCCSTHSCPATCHLTEHNISGLRPGGDTVSGQSQREYRRMFVGPGKVRCRMIQTYGIAPDVTP